MSEKLEFAREAVSKSLTTLRQDVFRSDVRLTLIVRLPGVQGADLVYTDDALYWVRDSLEKWILAQTHRREACCGNPVAMCANCPDAKQ